jgi:hypothetical protein
MEYKIEKRPVAAFPCIFRQVIPWDKKVRCQATNPQLILWGRKFMDRPALVFAELNPEKGNTLNY